MGPAGGGRDGSGRRSLRGSCRLRAVARIVAAGRHRGEVEDVRVEGHEQFAIRCVSAGAFVVPKGPSLDPAVKRLAVQVEDRSTGHNDPEGPTEHATPSATPLLDGPRLGGMGHAWIAYIRRGAVRS